MNENLKKLLVNINQGKALRTSFSIPQGMENLLVREMEVTEQGRSALVQEALRQYFVNKYRRN